MIIEDIIKNFARQEIDSLISAGVGPDDFSIISKEELVEEFTSTSTKKQVLQAEEEGHILEVSETTERYLYTVWY